MFTVPGDESVFSAAPQSSPRSLPRPNPSALSKPPTIWDKQHISDTLLAIGSGLLSGHNFGDGLAAAAQGIQGQSARLKAEQAKSVTYGGPDDQFEITTDGRGNRTVRAVPEFAAAADRKARASHALSPDKALDIRSRAIYQISQMPAERRQAAYTDLVNNPTRYGIDTSGMPDTWSNDYGSVAGSLGTPVAQTQTIAQKAADAEDRRTYNGQKIAQGDRRLAQGDERTALTKQRMLRTPPPGARASKPRSGVLKIGTQMGGRTFMGGDPHSQSSWK